MMQTGVRLDQQHTNRLLRFPYTQKNT